jgi:hypothetical protein
MVDEFDGLGRLVLGGGDRVLVAAAQKVEFLFKPGDAAAGFGQFIGDDDRRHHGQPHVADLAEAGAHIGDLLIDAVAEPLKMRLLPVIASHAIIASGNGDCDFGHALLVTLENVANVVDRRIEPARHIAIGRFEARRARIGMIELFGESRAIIRQKCNFGFAVGAGPALIENARRRRLKHSYGRFQPVKRTTECGFPHTQ